MPRLADTPYSATLCDERHQRITEDTAEIKTTLGNLRDDVQALTTALSGAAAWKRILPWIVAALLGGGGAVGGYRIAAPQPLQQPQTSPAASPDAGPAR